MVHRIAIQEDNPLLAWSCGTFAMSTTFHLLLGNQHPHTLPSGYISREHMLTLHKSLLKWLLTGSHPSLWGNNCMVPDINAPHNAEPGANRPLSIAAAVALPHGRPWHPCRIATPAHALRAPTLPPHRPPKRMRPLQRAPLLNSAAPPPDSQPGALPPPPLATPLPEPIQAAPPNIPHIHRTAGAPP
jgi:hypothetical protein